MNLRFGTVRRQRGRALLLGLLVGFVWVSPAFGRAGTEGVPLFFSASQEGAHAAYIARTPGFAVGVEAETATFWLRRTSASPLKSWSQESLLKLRLLGVTARPAGEVEGELPTRLNFFQGRDPSAWRTGVKTFERVRYRDVYPNIDVVYYGNDRQLEYDFVVGPGADPRAIRFTFEGADSIRLSPEGDLILRTSGGELRQRRPIAYQRDGLRRDPVSVTYQLGGGALPEVGFAVGAYDLERPLVIDPVVVYAGYLGGSAFDICRRLLIQDSGRVVVVGETASLNFPVQNPLLLTNEVTITNVPPEGGEGVITNSVVTNYYGGISHGGPGKDVGNPLGTEAVVAAFSADGQVLEFCTYLGGNAIDAAIDVAQDAEGNLLVYGLTQSADFPVVTNAWVRIASTNVCVTNVVEGIGEVLECEKVFTNTWPIPEDWETPWKIEISGEPYWGYYQLDAFLTKLSAEGDDILFSLYQGSDGNDQGLRVAVGPEGRIYLAWLESSGNRLLCMQGDDLVYDLEDYSFFRTSIPFPLALVPTTSQELWIGGYLGSSTTAISDSFAEWTTNLDGTTNLVWRIDPPYQDASGGGKEGALMRVTPDGDLAYLTYLGGSGEDSISGLVLNDDGGLTVVGDTFSTNFPVLSALVATNSGKGDLFVTRFDPTLTNLMFSTYLGGKSTDHVERVTVSARGDLFLAGSTLSTNFPGASPLVTTTGKKTEGLLASVASDGSQLRFAILLGGPGQDGLYDVAMDAEGFVWVAGATQGGWETNYGSVVTTNWWNVVQSTNMTPPAIDKRAMAGVVARLYPGEPELQMGSDAEGYLLLSWPKLLSDYVLQSATNVASTPTDGVVEVSNRWMNVQGVVLSGTNWIYSVTNRNLQEYFQLERQVPTVD